MRFSAKKVGTNTHFSDSCDVQPDIGKKVGSNNDAKSNKHFVWSNQIET